MKKYRYFSYVTLTHGLIALISYLALLACDHVLFFPVTKTIYLPTYLILFSTAMRLSQKNKAYTSGLRAVVIGSLYGYAISCISYLATQVLSPHSLNSLTNSIARFGVWNIPFAFFIFLPGIITGGWFAGAIGMFVLNALGFRHTNNISSG